MTDGWVVFDCVIGRRITAISSPTRMPGITTEQFTSAYTGQRPRYDRGCGGLGH